MTEPDMPMRKFDASKPHHHICPTCHKQVYCAAPHCEMPEHAECHECRSGFEFLTMDGEMGYWKKRPRRFEDDTGR